MDLKEYLQDDFDPKSYKVAQLRNVLNEHNIEYHSNAKKTDLVKLFEEEIFPKRKVLLKEYTQSVDNANEEDFVDHTKGDQVPAKKSKKKSSSKDKVLKAKTKPKKVVSEELEPPVIAISSKESTPFSQENIFQSPPSGAQSGTQRKRKVSEELKKDSKPSKKLKIGGLFDEEDDEEKFHKEVLQGFTPRKAKKQANDTFDTPNKLTSRSNISTPKLNSIDQELEKSESSTPDLKKDVLEYESEAKEAKGPEVKSPASPKVKSPASPKVKSPVSPKVKTPRSSRAGSAKSSVANTPKEAKVKSPKSPAAKVVDQILEAEIEQKDSHLKSSRASSTRSTPRTSKTKASPRQGVSVRFSPSTDDKKEFKSLKEETEDFDKFAKKSNADELKDIPETRTPEPVKPKVVLTPGPKLTPKPRKTVFDQIQENSLQNTEKHEASSDSEEDHEEEDEEVDDEADESQLSKDIPTNKSFKYFFIYIFLWILLSMAGIFGHWYGTQTVLIGYCGHSIDEPTFYNTEYPILNKLSEYLDSFKPQCVKCPSHARCFEYLEIGCYEDFIESKPWYFDVLPFLSPEEKKCIPDTKKAEKLESMIQYSLDLLRSKNAIVNCGTGDDNIESGISKDELYQLLLGMKAPYITIEEFDELWERSVIELEKEPEIITELSDDNIPTDISSDQEGYEKKDKNQIFRSTSLQNINLKCQLQNTLIFTLYSNKEYIIGLMILSVILIIMKLKYDDLQNQKKKINSIYDEVMDRLKSQTSQPIKYIGANQLRDLILPIDNLKYKLKLWNAVSKKIEKNSNVTYKTIEHHGDIIKVWEWVSHFDE